MDRALMGTTVFLIRNAATDWVKEGRFTGRREIALSAEGVAQTERLAAKLAGLEFAEILSSPLPRAVQTAEQIATAHGIEVARDPRLSDIHVGAWEGLTHEAIRVTPE